MESTSTIRTLKLEGMTGNDCVEKVKSTLQGVKGVTTQSVLVGSATIKFDSPSQCDAACAALAAAGFAVADGGASGNAGDKQGAKSMPAAPQTKGGNDMANEGAGGAIDSPKPSKISHSAAPVTGKPAQQATPMKPAVAAGV